MSRRNSGAAEAAAAQASEAARVLQARQQEAKAAAAPEPKAEPAAEPKRRTDAAPEIPEGRLEALRNANPRHKAMDSIIKNRGGDDDEPPAEPKAEPAKEPEAKQEAVPETAPAAPPQPEAPKTVRVKVDGEEFDAPAEEVEAAGGVHAYQRDKASERRLQRANEALAEAKRLQASVQEILAKQPPAAPPQPEKSVRQLIAEKSDVIRFGTPEEMAEALESIISSAAKPVDQNALTARLQAEIDHTAAVRQFDRENADLLKVPVIRDALIGRRASLLQEHQRTNPGQPVDWQNFYSKLAHEVRGAFGRQSQPATPSPQTPSNPSQASEKEARKASITNLPQAAARAQPPAEEKPLSPEEERKQAIAELRRSRGQAAG